MVGQVNDQHDSKGITMSSLSSLTPGTWAIDKAHSRIGFVARHLMITKVRGNFNDFEGNITIADNVANSNVAATVLMASISTGDDARDGHLRTNDFFDVETHPTMTFVSKGLSVDGNDGKLSGDLTLRGVTKPVTFDVEFEGVSTDPWGNTKAGFTAVTEINRKDFGVEWNAVLETGGVAVGEKVKIELDIQAVKG
jgi:polyisoprenoid-binding protein YceI